MSGQADHKGTQITKGQNTRQRKGSRRHSEGERSGHIFKGAVQHLGKLLSQNVARLRYEGGINKTPAKELEVTIASTNTYRFFGV